MTPRGIKVLGLNAKGSGSEKVGGGPARKQEIKDLSRPRPFPAFAVAPYCIVLHCITLYYFVLYYIVIII